MGLSERVTFTGRITTEELVKHYCQAEVVVVPSLFEGFGLPAVEAMACGAPVVATTMGALPEVVGNDGAGVLIPPGECHRSRKVKQRSPRAKNMLKKGPAQMIRARFQIG
jgi:glycosyltransferase involved in cell wall biosynthesis